MAGLNPKVAVAGVLVLALLALNAVLWLWAFLLWQSIGLGGWRCAGLACLTTAAGWWLLRWSVKTPPRWLVRRRNRATFRKMAWPGGEWRGWRIIFMLGAVWSAWHVIHAPAGTGTIFGVVVAGFYVHASRRATGLRLRMLLHMRRIRRQPWVGYEGAVRCAQCGGSGWLPSRRYVDVRYRCNACRPRC